MLSGDNILYVTVEARVVEIGAMVLAVVASSIGVIWGLV
jgi:hypothetical protein